MQDSTLDTLFDGRIMLRQPLSGYRFSVDPILLAHHCGPLCRERVLDMGTGCGVIPLILGYRHKGIKITGVEIQPELAALARENVKANRLTSAVSIMEKDIRSISFPVETGSFDLVVSNPPFREARAGRIPPNPGRAVARHEISLTLEGLLSASEKALMPGGRFMVVYPALRTADLLLEMRKAGLEPKRLRSVHPRANLPARLILAEGVKGGNSGLNLLTPLVLHTEGNAYTPEVEKMFRP